MKLWYYGSFIFTIMFCCSCSNGCWTPMPVVSCGYDDSKIWEETILETLKKENTTTEQQKEDMKVCHKQLKGGDFSLSGYTNPFINCMKDKGYSQVEVFHKVYDKKMYQQVKK